MYFYRKKKNGSASIIRFKIRLYFLSFSHFCFFPPSLHNFGGRKRNKLMIRDHKHKQCCALHGFIADRRRTQRGGKEKTKADQPPLRSLAPPYIHLIAGLVYQIMAVKICIRWAQISLFFFLLLLYPPRASLFRGKGQPHQPSQHSETLSIH